VTEPVLNAYALITADLALDAARKAEGEIAAGHYRGPLHGIPVAVKDLYDMEGLPTRCSSEVRHDRVARADSACVERLKAAGAVIVGKTHTHEFAYGIMTPTTANPWTPERIPGGSPAARVPASRPAAASWVSVRTPAARSAFPPRSVARSASSRPTAGSAGQASPRSAGRSTMSGR
jgi:aspartyl-tRNA(Asn)/glutamyl-tRNA(Gln) amidotransferase subunit A